jgi:hypothetical protein
MPKYTMIQCDKCGRKEKENFSTVATDGIGPDLFTIKVGIMVFCGKCYVQLRDMIDYWLKEA